MCLDYPKIKKKSIPIYTVPIMKLIIYLVQAINFIQTA